MKYLAPFILLSCVLLAGCNETTFSFAGTGADAGCRAGAAQGAFGPGCERPRLGIAHFVPPKSLEGVS